MEWEECRYYFFALNIVFDLEKLGGFSWLGLSLGPD
jgi:hypothetical protein